MGIINRFLLFIYALVQFLFALFIIAFMTKALPEHVFYNEISFVLHQSVTLTVFAVIAVFSVYFLLYTFFVGEKKESKPKENGVIIKTEAGEVRVAIDAVEALADREATSVSGVRESATEIITSNKEGEAPLSLKLTLVLLSGANVPKVSETVISAVKKRVFDSLGIKDAPVNVSVRDLNSTPDENQKRVH